MVINQATHTKNCRKFMIVSRSLIDILAMKLFLMDIKIVAFLFHPLFLQPFHIVHSQWLLLRFFPIALMIMIGKGMVFPGVYWCSQTRSYLNLFPGFYRCLSFQCFPKKQNHCLLSLFQHCS